MNNFANEPEEFVAEVITPVLTALELDKDHSSATIELLLGTALQESGLVHRVCHAIARLNARRFQTRSHGPRPFVKLAVAEPLIVIHNRRPAGKHSRAAFQK